LRLVRPRITYVAVGSKLKYSGSDPQLRIRLIAVHISGLLQIFTLSRHPGSTSWIFDEDPVTTETVANPLPQGIFILDSKSGAQWKADRGRLGASLHPTAVQNTHGICVTTGAKGARSVVDITGERIGKTDWGSKGGIVQNVQIVEKNSKSHRTTHR
jgi:syntaxin-binding protein 5